MKQVRLPFMEACDHEDNEVEFLLLKEYDYPFLCVIKDIDHLENEDIEDMLIDELFE